MATGEDELRRMIVLASLNLQTLDFLIISLHSRMCLKNFNDNLVFVFFVCCNWKKVTKVNLKNPKTSFWIMREKEREKYESKRLAIGTRLSSHKIHKLKKIYNKRNKF